MAPSPYHTMAATFAQGFAVIAVIALIAVNAVGVFTSAAPSRAVFAYGVAWAVLACLMGWVNWRLAAIGASKRAVDIATGVSVVLGILSLIHFVLGAS